MPDTITRGFHKEWRATHVEDFVLDYLPPYSPALNPIERIWKLTRRQCLHNRYFPVAAVEKQFETGVTETKPYAAYAQSLKTLCLEVIVNVFCSARLDAFRVEGEDMDAECGVFQPGYGDDHHRRDNH